jgi:hypothetical protein
MYMFSIVPPPDEPPLRFQIGWNSYSQLGSTT